MISSQSFTKPVSRVFAAIVVVIATASPAFADLIVAPNAYANTPAGSGGLSTFIRELPRTGQLLINSNQFGALSVGDQITGLTFRLWQGSSASFPAQDATWSDYTIKMGQGVAFGSQTTTFANNFIGAPSTVRSGALTIEAGSFLAGSTPNPWGSMIDFDTPYTYTGGNLLIEIRHSSSNIVNLPENTLECVLTSGAGYGVDFWAAAASDAGATTGSQGSFTVTALNIVHVPAPGALALLGMAGLIGSRRRRN